MVSKPWSQSIRLVKRMLWDYFLYCINDSIQDNSETGNKIFVLPSKVAINILGLSQFVHTAICFVRCLLYQKCFIKHHDVWPQCSLSSAEPSFSYTILLLKAESFLLTLYYFCKDTFGMYPKYLHVIISNDSKLYFSYENCSLLYWSKI